MAIGYAFFTMAVGHAYSLNMDIRERSSMVYESLFNMELIRDQKHTGVYVEKRPCHYYDDQPHLQLVYGVTWTRYTDLPVHAVSSLQGPEVWGMSLLETSSF